MSTSRVLLLSLFVSTSNCFPQRYISTCAPCSSQVECLFVTHTAAYRLKSCDGASCEGNCAWGHSGTLQSSCDATSGQYKFIGCDPIQTMRGPARLRSFWGKPNVTIWHLHTRKAGGTTLHKWLGRISKLQGWELIRREAESVDMVSLNEMKKTGVVISSLRHPVDRILSMYKFEGRWELNTLFRVLREKGRVNNSVIDSSFEQFMSKALSGGIHLRKTVPHNHCYFTIWGCVASCYLRKYSNNNCTTKYRNITGNEEALLDKALDVLDAIDFVVTTEDMADNYYLDRLTREFIIPKLVPFEHGIELSQFEHRIASVTASGRSLSQETEWLIDPVVCGESNASTMDYGCIIPVSVNLPGTSEMYRPEFTIAEHWPKTLSGLNKIDIGIHDRYCNMTYF